MITLGTRAAVVMTAALLLSIPAAAQQSTPLTLLAADMPRWDIAGYAGWLGSNKSEIGAEWDDWYNAGSGGATLGRYVGPHLKIEIQGGFSARGHIFTQDATPIATPPFVLIRAEEHDFRTASVGGAIAYQFFENQWLHPFVGGGIEAVREVHRIEAREPIVSGRDPTPVPPPAVRVTTETTWGARPFATAGVKFYMSQRLFGRADLRTTFSDRGAEHVIWSGGLGVDL